MMNDTKQLKTFILYWDDGSTEKVHGTTIDDAFRRAGYGGGAIAALDYYKEITDVEENN